MGFYLAKYTGLFEWKLAVGVYIIVFELILFTKNKRWMNLGIYPYILFALTVCNPLVIKVAGKIFGLSDRYYRFFGLFQ